MRLARGIVLGAAVGLLLAAAPGQTADPLEGLVRDSPFLPAAGGAAGPTESGALEFRGVVFERGGYTFSIYDQGTHESSWVRIGEKGLPFVVRSYNRESDTLVVEQNGRTLNLALLTAKVANAPAAAPPAPMPLPGPGQALPVPGNGPQPNLANGQPGPGGPVPANVSSEEAQRLQKMADEIRRRRNLRAGNPNSTNP